MPSTTRVDRVRGCMLGLAVGDALGAPLEGLSAQQIRAHYADRHRLRRRGQGLEEEALPLAAAGPLHRRHPAGPGPGRRPARHRPGRRRSPRGDLPRAGHARPGLRRRPRGVGKSFRQVLADLRRGVCPRRTGQASAGIGAAMRIAPVGLYFADDPDALFDAVMAASLMTHRDIRSLAGAMAVALAVARLLDGAVPRPELRLLARRRRPAGRGPDRRGVRRARSPRSAATAAASRRDRPGRVGPGAAPRAGPLGPDRRGGQPPRARLARSAADPGVPAGPDPDLPLPPPDDRQRWRRPWSTSSTSAATPTPPARSSGRSPGASTASGRSPIAGSSASRTSTGSTLRAVALAASRPRGLEIPDLVGRELELSDLEAANRDSRS